MTADDHLSEPMRRAREAMVHSSRLTQAWVFWVEKSIYRQALVSVRGVCFFLNGRISTISR
jgi:hypothetical protein